MIDNKDTIISRIAELPPEKRRLLAERIAEEKYRASGGTDETAAEQIIAYISPQNNARLDEHDLRAFLRERLPDFMIPSAFIMLDELPRTPNGKLDRRALPQNILPPKTPAVPESKASQAKEVFREIWKDVLGIEDIRMQDNFFELGGDSIRAIRVISRARQAGYRITPTQIFEHPVLESLAAAATAEQRSMHQSESEQGAVPLTPIQHWFFEQQFSDPDYWNQAVLLELSPGISPGDIESALRLLQERHDALRMRFFRTASGWQAYLAPLQHPLTIEQVDLSGVAPAQLQAQIQAHAGRVQAGLSLSKACLMKAAYFITPGKQANELLLVVHHLSVDAVSWSVLIEELSSACRASRRGEKVNLPEKTTSYKAWSETLLEYALSTAPEQEAPHWLALAETPPAQLPRDFPGSDLGNEDRASRITLTLNKKETARLLRELPAIYKTRINDVLLTALMQALTPWTGSRELYLGLEGHGRKSIVEGVDLSRTVGWFTAYYPALLSLPENSAAAVALKSIKEQLRAIPNNGIGYGILRYLGINRELSKSLSSLQEPELLFNYLSTLDGEQAPNPPMSVLYDAHPGKSRSGRNRRTHLLEVNVFVIKQQLRMEWIYSKSCHRPETIQGLADAFAEALRGLIALCEAPQEGGFTPSDFPESGLSQQELDDLIDELDD